MNHKYIRPDLIENLFEHIRANRVTGASHKLEITPQLIDKIKLTKTLIEKILIELDYVCVKDKKNEDIKYWIRRKKNKNIVNDNSKNDNNPFSILKNFKNASNL